MVSYGAAVIAAVSASEVLQWIQMPGSSNLNLTPRTAPMLLVAALGCK